MTPQYEFFISRRHKCKSGWRFNCPLKILPKIPPNSILRRALFVAWVWWDSQWGFRWAIELAPWPLAESLCISSSLFDFFQAICIVYLLYFQREIVAPHYDFHWNMPQPARHCVTAAPLAPKKPRPSHFTAVVRPEKCFHFSSPLMPDASGGGGGGRGRRRPNGR